MPWKFLIRVYKVSGMRAGHFSWFLFLILSMANGPRGTWSEYSYTWHGSWLTSIRRTWRGILCITIASGLLTHSWDSCGYTSYNTPLWVPFNTLRNCCTEQKYCICTSCFIVKNLKWKDLIRKQCADYILCGRGEVAVFTDSLALTDGDLGLTVKIPVLTILASQWYICISWSFMVVNVMLCFVR